MEPHAIAWTKGVYKVEIGQTAEWKFPSPEDAKRFYARMNAARGRSAREARKTLAMQRERDCKPAPSTLELMMCRHEWDGFSVVRDGSVVRIVREKDVVPKMEGE